MPMPRTTRSAGSTGNKITADGHELLEFTRKLIAVRKAYPILHRSRFLVGQYNEELDVKDVTWLSPTGD